MANCRIRFGILLIGALEVLYSLGAQARPRDEVMSRAFRCAVIADSRTWLDCYYGAAQPARAALGLQPASPAQLNLVLTPPAGNPKPNDVAIRDQVIAGAIRCNDFTDERQWLDCYYGAAQPERADLGLLAAPQAAVGSLPSPHGSTAHMKSEPVQGSNTASPQLGTSQNSNQGGFGLDVKAEPSGQPDHVDAQMVSYTFDKFGIFTVNLSNGQVWRQLEGDTSNAHWDKPAASYAVLITRGFLGSYNLRVKNNPSMFKVRRVR